MYGKLILFLSGELISRLVGRNFFVNQIKMVQLPEPTDEKKETIGFKDAEVKTNAMQILKQFGIEDVKSL